MVQVTKATGHAASVPAGQLLPTFQYREGQALDIDLDAVIEKRNAILSAALETLEKKRDQVKREFEEQAKQNGTSLTWLDVIDRRETKQLLDRIALCSLPAAEVYPDKLVFPGSKLFVQTNGFSEMVTVESSGHVPCGIHIGRVYVVGMTFEQAEVAILAKLGPAALYGGVVQVTGANDYVQHPAAEMLVEKLRELEE